MTVLNKHHHGGKVPPGAINIMRGTPFGNRFQIGKDGTRAEVVEKYRKELWLLLQHDITWQDAVLGLYGKDVCCCCAPLACHGDVLERAAEWMHNQRSAEVQNDQAKENETDQAGTRAADCVGTR